MARTRGIQVGGTRPRAGKEAVAAVAVAGAAAVGGKLAWDRLSAGSDADFARAYRLHDGEPVPDGIRRIARGQLESARADLDGVSTRKLEEAVHETRKRLKRLRACLRLARDAIGQDTYQGENAAFRDAGRRLSGARDATVLIETLEALEKWAGDELRPGASAALVGQLEVERQRAVASLEQDEAAIAAVVRELETARTRTAGWTFGADGFDALEPGLRRIYRRGRRAMKATADEPSTENLHEWRKRAKDLWHVLQILRPAGPKRIRSSRDAHISCRTCSATTTTWRFCATTSRRIPSAFRIRPPRERSWASSTGADRGCSGRPWASGRASTSARRSALPDRLGAAGRSARAASHSRRRADGRRRSRLSGAAVQARAPRSPHARRLRTAGAAASPTGSSRRWPRRSRRSWRGHATARLADGTRVSWRRGEWSVTPERPVTFSER
jgi:CHAD domain-containing protein